MSDDDRCDHSRDTDEYNSITKDMVNAISLFGTSGIGQSQIAELVNYRTLLHGIATRRTNPDHIATKALSQEEWLATVLQCVESPTQLLTLVTASERLDAMLTNARLPVFRCMGIQVCFALGCFDVTGHAIARLSESSARHGTAVIGRHLCHVLNYLLAPEVRRALSSESRRTIEAAVANIESLALREHVLRQLQQS